MLQSKTFLQLFRLSQISEKKNEMLSKNIVNFITLLGHRINLISISSFVFSGRTLLQTRSQSSIPNKFAFGICFVIQTMSTVSSSIFFCLYQYSFRLDCRCRFCSDLCLNRRRWNQRGGCLFVSKELSEEG